MLWPLPLPKPEICLCLCGGGCQRWAAWLIVATGAVRRPTSADVNTRLLNDLVRVFCSPPPPGNTKEVFCNLSLRKCNVNYLNTGSSIVRVRFIECTYNLGTTTHSTVWGRGQLLCEHWIYFELPQCIHLCSTCVFIWILPFFFFRPSVFIIRSILLELCSRFILSLFYIISVFLVEFPVTVIQTSLSVVLCWTDTGDWLKYRFLLRSLRVQYIILDGLESWTFFILIPVASTFWLIFVNCK